MRLNIKGTKQMPSEPQDEEQPICPITRETIRLPVFLIDGEAKDKAPYKKHLFELHSIFRWVVEQGATTIHPTLGVNVVKPFFSPPEDSNKKNEIHESLIALIDKKIAAIDKDPAPLNRNTTILIKLKAFLAVCLKLEPKDYRIFLHRSNIYKLKNNLDKAIREIETSLELEKTNAWLWNASGKLYFAKGNYPNSKDHFLKAIQIDDKISIFHYNYALALAKTKQSEKARQQFFISRELQKQNPSKCIDNTEFNEHIEHELSRLEKPKDPDPDVALNHLSY